MIRRIFYVLTDEQPIFSLVLVIALFVPSFSLVFFPGFVPGSDSYSWKGLLYWAAVYIPLVFLIIYRRGKEILLLRVHGLGPAKILVVLFPHLLFISTLQLVFFFFMFPELDSMTYFKVFLMVISVLILTHLPALMIPQSRIYSLLFRI